MNDSFETDFLPSENIEDYIAVGRTIFPDADWAGYPARFEKMTQVWKQGIIVCRHLNRIVGYITLWPISEKSAQQYEAGSLGDGDFNASHLALPSGNTNTSHWLMTAIAVIEKTKEHRRLIIHSLLKAASQQLANYAPNIIFAHAHTQDGVRFLSRCGFQKVEGNIHNLYRKENWNHDELV